MKLVLASTIIALTVSTAAAQQIPPGPTLYPVPVVPDYPYSPQSNPMTQPGWMNFYLQNLQIQQLNNQILHDMEMENRRVWENMRQKQRTEELENRLKWLELQNAGR